MPLPGVARGAGIGLRKEHHEQVLSDLPPIGWFEVISENFMVDGGKPRHVLEQVREHYPVVMHGVSLSIGSDDPVDSDYLERLVALERWLQPLMVSDHLCWSSVGGHNSHDLLPMPRTEDAVIRVVEKVKQVQDALGRRLLLENISSYLEFQTNQCDEATFLADIAERADCWILFDVNNLFVNARNHGLDPIAYIDRLPIDRVRQFHLAGHSDFDDVIIDTHDGPVREDVWSLYRRAVRRFGALPTLIEWDAQIPALEVVLDEARKADQAAQEEVGRDREIA
jgi:uncharacterized protein (UPF0276 family)